VSPHVLHPLFSKAPCQQPCTQQPVAKGADAVQAPALRFCAPTICTPSMTAMLLKERSSQVRFVRLSRFSIFSIMLLSSCRRRRPTQWLGSHPHQYQTVAQTRAHCYLLSKLATCLVSKYALLFSCRDQVEMSTSGHTAFRKRPAMLRLYIDIHRFPSRADGTGRKTL